MADTTINNLTPATTVNSNFTLPISNGTNTLKATVAQVGVPVGTIVMWSNYNGASIPTGWALCDGQAGRPDLRNRFVVASGSTYNVGDVGGADSITLAESQIPSHRHYVTGTSGGESGHTHLGEHLGNQDQYTTVGYLGSLGNRSGVQTGGAANNHTHSIDIWSQNTGGNGSFDNRPQYYALAFIIKIN